MNKKIEKIYDKPAQPGMVGDGFRVYNFIPGVMHSQRRLSPFLMLDFNPAYNFGASEVPRGVGAHPHKGFETVTIAYKGSVEHHDSTGNHGVIHPGDVQWMTAGNGLLHKEYHEKEFAQKGGEFEVVQLWINLPKKDKSVAPHYQTLMADNMGIARLGDDGSLVRIIAGEYNGVKGPAKTYTDVNLFDFRLKNGNHTHFEVPATHTTALLVINGAVTVNGEKAPQHSFVLFANEGTNVDIQADEDSVVLLLSGEPIDEPIVHYGPFVMNTQEEIYDAIMDFQKGKYGVLD